MHSAFLCICWHVVRYQNCLRAPEKTDSRAIQQDSQEVATPGEVRTTVLSTYVLYSALAVTAKNCVKKLDNRDNCFVRERSCTWTFKIDCNTVVSQGVKSPLRVTWLRLLCHKCSQGESQSAVAICRFCTSSVCRRMRSSSELMLNLHVADGRIYFIVLLTQL